MKLSVFFTVLLTSLLHLTACAEESGSSDYEVPPHLNLDDVTSKEEGYTRLVSYNVGVFNKYDTSSIELIATMMQELEPDAICMNELDNGCNRTDNVNQLRSFASLMGGWHYLFGAAIDYDGGEYGEGIASELTPITEYTIALEKGEGSEARVLVVMEFDNYVFAATHLDHVSEVSQLSHVATITSEMQSRYGESGKAVVLAGDLNCTPDSDTIAALTESWTIISATDEATFPSKGTCIDYFLILNNGASYEVSKYEVMRYFECCMATSASDHYPIMIDIKF